MKCRCKERSYRKPEHIITTILIVLHIIFGSLSFMLIHDYICFVFIVLCHNSCIYFRIRDRPIHVRERASGRVAMAMANLSLQMFQCKRIMCTCTLYLARDNNNFRLVQSSMPLISCEYCRMRGRQSFFLVSFKALISFCFGFLL